MEIPGLVIVKYVTNSPWTVQGESFSEGRLYDKIDDISFGRVMYVLQKDVLCRTYNDIIETQGGKSKENIALKISAFPPQMLYNYKEQKRNPYKILLKCIYDRD